MSTERGPIGVGWVMQGWGGSQRGGVGHAGVGWVIQGWDGSCWGRGGVGYVAVVWGGSCRVRWVMQG